MSNLLYREKPGCVYVGNSKTRWLMFDLNVPSTEDLSGYSLQDTFLRYHHSLDCGLRSRELAVKFIVERSRPAIPLGDNGMLVVHVPSERDETLVRLQVGGKLRSCELVTDAIMIQKGHFIFDYLKEHGLIEREPTPREKRKGRYQRKRERLRQQLND